MSVEELYSHLVLYLGLDAEYVMDRMQVYEVGALMRHGHKKHMVEYECARLGAYVTASCHTSKKNLKPTDIIKFSWEDEEAKQDKKVKKEAKRRVKETTESDITDLMKRMRNSRKNVTEKKD